MRLCAAVPASSATARNGSRASAEAGSILAPRPLASRNAPPAAAILGDAVRIGERRGSRRRSNRSCRRRCWLAGARSAQRLAMPPRVLAAARAVAAELIEPVARSTSSPPSPRSRQDRGDLGGALARAFARRHRPPCARAAAAAASAAGLRPSSVMRPSASSAPSSVEQRPRLGQRGRRRRIEKGELGRIGGAPLREIEQQARQIGGEDFRPGIGLRATRSAARPTAGSRRRARCGRRGRGADRRRRATPARSRAASGRRRARSAARARARSRSRCARPRW